MDGQVSMVTASGDAVSMETSSGDQASGQQDNDMVQYVIYSGEGDTPIALEELRDALTKLTGQQVALGANQNKPDDQGAGLDDSTVPPELAVAQPALSQDTDLGFRLSAERMVGEVSFIGDDVIDRSAVKAEVKQSRSAPVLHSLIPNQVGSLSSSKLVIDDSPASNLPISQLLKRQEQQRKLREQQQQQLPTHITIETEYGPITLDTSKLTPGQLNGTEQITVNLLTTDANGQVSTEATETRGLKLPPGGILGATRSAPKEIRIAGFPDSVNDETIQGSDFVSVLQQLTDLCSEQIPLPVQDGTDTDPIIKQASGEAGESAASALEDYINLKFHDKPGKSAVEVNRLESFLKTKFGDHARIIQKSTPVKQTICCAAHSELKNQETRRRLLPIPLDVSKCPSCNHECMNRKGLRQHIQRFHIPDFKHQCQTRVRVLPQLHDQTLADVPILVENAKSIDSTLDKTAPKSYSCTICEAEFSSQKEYVSHVQCHGEKKVMCTICGLKFIKLTSLRAHVNAVHNGKHIYQCRHCAQSFTTNLSWRQHEQRHRSPNRGTIICLLCQCLIPQEKFRRHMALLHKVTHKAKLDCPFCGERFKSAEKMSSHTRQVHDFEKNANLCPMCYKAYPSTNERDAHILTQHTDAEMMEVDVEFSWQPKDCYRRQCGRCGVTKPTYQSLKAHFDKHSPDDKNHCIICGNDFYWIVNLDLHYKREHQIEDLIKYGVKIPTMNIIRHDSGSFELVPKEGRQFATRFDLVDAEQQDPGADYTSLVVQEYPDPPNNDKPAMYDTVDAAKKAPSIVEPVEPQPIDLPTPAKPAQKTPHPVSLTEVKTGKTAAIPKPRKVRAPVPQPQPAPQPINTTASGVSKVIGKDFDYSHHLPKMDATSDLSAVKAPRHMDIVMGREATVINLARVWSRRERKLFYLGNEEARFRRAATTIPKKRVEGRWEEMPLFLDELSGKLVTVEGMAEIWRERAQMFLDTLGKGQLISDFLPLYHLGDQGNVPKKSNQAESDREEKKPDESKSSSSDKEGKSPKKVGKKGDGRGTVLPKQTKSGRTLKYTSKAKAFAKTGGDVSDAESGSVDSVVSEDDLDEGHEEPVAEESDTEQQELRRDEEIDETMFTRVLVNVSDSESQQKKRAKKVQTVKKDEPDAMSVISKGIRQAKKAMKARAQATKATRVHPERGLIQEKSIKGKRGCPPGFNPDRYSPFPKRPRLVLSDISDIVGDAKKIIVQMETMDKSPERKPWKKQTARKSFPRPQPGSSRASSAAKSARSRDRDSKKDEEETKRSDTSAKAYDVVDGPRRSSRASEPSRREKSSKEPSDKGAAKETPKRGNTKGSGDAKTSDSAKRGASKTAESSQAKRAKTSSSKSQSAVSPRDAVLSSAKPGRPAKPDPQTDDKTSKQTSKKEPVKKDVPKKESTKKPEMPKKDTTEAPASDVTSERTEEEGKPIVNSDSDRDSPPMPMLELQFPIHEGVEHGAHSPVPSSSNLSDDSNLNPERKQLMDSLLNDIELEEACINTARKSIKMVLHDAEPSTVRLVGSACSAPTETKTDTTVDAWDALVGASPVKTPQKQTDPSNST